MLRISQRGVDVFVYGGGHGTEQRKIRSRITGFRRAARGKKAAWASKAQRARRRRLISMVATGRSSTRHTEVEERVSVSDRPALEKGNWPRRGWHRGLGGCEQGLIALTRSVRVPIAAARGRASTSEIRRLTAGSRAATGRFLLQADGRGGGARGRNDSARATKAGAGSGTLSAAVKLGGKSAEVKPTAKMRAAPLRRSYVSAPNARAADHRPDDQKPYKGGRR